MKHLIYLLIAGMLLSSCRKNDHTDIEPVNLGVKVSFNAASYTLPVGNVSIRIKNVNTGTTQTLTSDNTGTVTFSGVPAGVYDIDATVTIPAATYTQITGIQTTADVVFNASSKNTQINVGFTGNIELKLVAGTVGDWVIKQVYYAGSDTKNGAIQRDQFIEFYNNSDKVLYADSLYFAELVGVVSLPATAYNVLPTNQMDWSKSVGMPSNIDANRDYVYSRALLMIPGTGKQYPVQPGKSIVVAQTGINHKAPFTGTDGKQVTVLDPSLTVDLSGADFEAYYADIIPNPFPSDVNTGVPNVQVIQYFGRDMVFDTNGRYSYVLFKADASVNVKNLPQYPYPTKAVPSSTAAKYYQIPSRLILDAVEVQPNLAADRIPKKLNPSLDAGFAFVPMGAFTSQSIIRKTEKTVNGRIILKDTNNSTEDFDYLTTASPRAFK